MLDDRSINQIILITREVKIIENKKKNKVKVYNNQPKNIPFYVLYTIGAAISNYDIMAE
jgi:hypothetical protein